MRECMPSTEITFLRAVVICIWYYFHRPERDAGPIRGGNTRLKQVAMVVVYVSLGGGSDSDWDGSHLPGAGITTYGHD
jgi:hypothetical protein